LKLLSANARASNPHQDHFSLSGNFSGRNIIYIATRVRYITPRDIAFRHVAVTSFHLRLSVCPKPCQSLLLLIYFPEFYC
jgi:hypothetical protein